MDDKSLRRRLEALNRAPILGAIRQRPASTDIAAVTDRSAAAPARSAPTPTASSNGPTAHVASSLPAARSIAGLLDRGEVVRTRLGEHLRICLPIEPFWPGGTRLVSARQQHLQELHVRAQQAVEPTVVMGREIAAFIAALPDRTLLLDLETCGLAGSALFLVGLLRQIEDTPTVELLLARNYAEEPAVLDSLWSILPRHDVLVTFNGKSFDWPMVLERSIRHRLRPSPTGPSLHLDVLHYARRRWRRHLPDCRLQTLERHICRRARPEDIPGHRIPSVYAEFVRTGFKRDLETVLYHNALDLVTLFDLSLRLA